MNNFISQRSFSCFTFFVKAVVCTALLVFSSISPALDIPSYTITYEVVIKKLVAGKLVINVSEGQNGAVTIHGETFPNMFAKTFGDGKVVELIKYKKVDGKLRLQSVKEIIGEAQSQVKESIVNWDNKTITTNGTTTAFTPNTQMDAYTLPFLRVLGLDEASEDSSTKVVSAKKALDYIYEAPAQDSLKVAGKGYDATRHTKYRSNDKNRKISLWISNNSPVMPLKVEITKKGKRHSWVTITDIKHK